MLQVCFNPFPVLESDKLILNAIGTDDADQVFTMRSDPETMKYIPRPMAKTRQDALDHIAMISKGIEDNEFINWGIRLRGEDKLAGMICLLRMQPQNYRTEIGYILHPAYHGKGIMHQAVQLVLEYAFKVLKFHSVEAVIDPANGASENVLLKHHFVKEAHLRENVFYEGRFLDSVIYSIINPDNAALSTEA